MASGCAVISTAPVEFEGVRVRAGDREGVIQAVKRLWEDPETTRQLGEENMALAQRYRWDRYMDDLLDCYRTAIQGFGRPPRL
jgi:glycosyltransferase involved in cell wall biosynthesis